MCGCTGNVTWYLSFHLSIVPVPVSGRSQGWFPLPGLPGYLLALFCALIILACPANLLGPSSHAHQLEMSLLKTILMKYYNILRKNYIVHLTLFIFFSTFCKHITCWRPWIDCSISVKVMWLKEFCPKFFLLHLRTDRAILKTNHHKIKFLEYFLEGKQ